MKIINAELVKRWAPTLVEHWATVATAIESMQQRERNCSSNCQHVLTTAERTLYQLHISPEREMTNATRIFKSHVTRYILLATI